MAFFLGPRRVIGLTPGKGGGVSPPPGFAWLTDFEGNPVFDFEGVRLYGAV